MDTRKARIDQHEAAATRRRAEDLAMISNPDLWPNWPILPLKRYDPTNNWPLCYTLIEQPLGRYTLLHCSMFDQWKDAERTEFASAQDVIDAGWMVD